jgi:hypothetical protein
MLHSYDIPEWAEDEEYDYCESLTEMKILRVVLTYQAFVEQRYTKKRRFTYNTYDATKRGCIRRIDSRVHKAYEKLVDLIPDDRDPAHFVAYVFESWRNRDIYQKLTFHSLDEKSGVAYPSLKFIYTNADKLTKDWLTIRRYKPTGFVPVDDLRERDVNIIENKVNRWCAAHDRRPADFWTSPETFYTLNPAYIQCSTSIKENREEVEAYWRMTLEELYGEMVRMRGLIEKFQDQTYLAIKHRNEERRKLGLEPEYENLDVLEDE